MRADEDWRDDAECLGEDPDIFFPTQGESTDQARAICARCPVAAECLDFALAGGEKFGIWGGKSERERRRLRRERAASHGTRAKYGSGCRCEPCTAANRRYKTAQLRRQREAS